MNGIVILEAWVKLEKEVDLLISEGLKRRFSFFLCTQVFITEHMLE